MHASMSSCYSRQNLMVETSFSIRQNKSRIMAKVLPKAFILCFYLTALYSDVYGYQDYTLEDQATGSDVVIAVIAKLDTFGLASEDSNGSFWQIGVDSTFFRTLAFIESLDGKDVQTFPHKFDGGIWKVGETEFKLTQDTDRFPALSNFHDTINEYSRDYLGTYIHWQDVVWHDLTKPLYSAIAAKLYQTVLSLSPGYQPQCTLSFLHSAWSQKVYYCECYRNGRCNKTQYDLRIEEFNSHDFQNLDCTVSLDVIFILDSSEDTNRADSNNWERMVQFVYNLSSIILPVRSDESGREQVQNHRIGVVTVGDIGNIDISFTSNRNNLLSNISSLQYLNESRNIADGLCRLTDEIQWRNEAAVSKLAVLLTVGNSQLLSDANESQCGNLSTAARLVHSLDPAVTVYVIKGTNDTNDGELDAIASSPARVLLFDEFDEQILLLDETQLAYSNCISGSDIIPVGNQTLYHDNFTVNDTRQYRYTITPEGTTIRLCITEGEVILYASSRVTHPNMVYNDFVLNPTLQPSNNTVSCEDVFVTPGLLATISGDRNKRQTANSNNSIQLYVVIEGKQLTSTFLLEDSSGDTTQFIVSCDQNPCSVNNNCTDHPIGYSCSCLPGYQLNSSLGCTDVNECEQMSEICHENATCSNTDGGFRCECSPMYTGNGTFCTDINECEQNETCHMNAVCVNVVGSFTCSCMEGYEGNGTYCSDYDECEGMPELCDELDNTICVNTEGDYECMCIEGYGGRVGLCTDVNECELAQDVCHKNAICSNREGGFDCKCIFGYRGNGTYCEVHTVRIVAVVGGSVGGIVFILLVIALDLYICHKCRKIRHKKDAEHQVPLYDLTTPRPSVAQPEPGLTFHNPHAPTAPPSNELHQGITSHQQGVMFHNPQVSRNLNLEQCHGTWRSGMGDIMDEALELNDWLSQ